MDSSSFPADDFEIITALRYDKDLPGTLATEHHASNGSNSSQLYILPRHQHRMLTAAKAFQWPETSQKSILGLEEQIYTHLHSTYENGQSTDPLKIRVTLSSSGILEVTSTKVATVLPSCLFPKSLTDLVSLSGCGSPPSFRVLVSTIPTLPSPFTRHKTTSRAPYDEARSRTMSLIKQSGGESASLPTEVLLYNKSGEIMEGSITTPYFSRGGEWITPSVECGGNLGTTRQYALDSGLCREGVVEKLNVKVGEQVVLSNGVRGFGWGIVDELNGM